MKAILFFSHAKQVNCRVLFDTWHLTRLPSYQAMCLLQAARRISRKWGCLRGIPMEQEKKSAVKTTKRQKKVQKRKQKKEEKRKQKKRRKSKPSEWKKVEKRISTLKRILQKINDRNQMRCRSRFKHGFDYPEYDFTSELFSSSFTINELSTLFMSAAQARNQTSLRIR